MIIYKIGDATNPLIEGNKIIAHVCNDIGKWGRGFVATINNKWKEPEIQYRSMKNRKLGEVQFVKVENDIIIANIIGQHLIIMNENENQSISYDAMKEGLKKVNELAIELKASIHSPKFVLSVSDWYIIEKIINETITVPIYIYSFKDVF